MAAHRFPFVLFICAESGPFSRCVSTIIPLTTTGMDAVPGSSRRVLAGGVIVRKDSFARCIGAWSDDGLASCGRVDWKPVPWDSDHRTFNRQLPQESEFPLILFHS